MRVIAVIHRNPDEREEIKLATFSDNLEKKDEAEIKQSETSEQTLGDTEHKADVNLDLRDRTLLRGVSLSRITQPNLEWPSYSAY